MRLCVWFANLIRLKAVMNSWPIDKGVFVWFPPKADLRQKCKCKWLIWEVILGNTVSKDGNWESKEKKDDLRSPLWKLYCCKQLAHNSTKQQWYKGQDGIHPNWGRTLGFLSTHFPFILVRNCFQGHEFCSQFSFPWQQVECAPTSGIRQRSLQPEATGIHGKQATAYQREYRGNGWSPVIVSAPGWQGQSLTWIRKRAVNVISCNYMESHACRRQGFRRQLAAATDVTLCKCTATWTKRLTSSDLTFSVQVTGELQRLHDFLGRIPYILNLQNEIPEE